MVGLCAFALVLALVEQVVLEGMEANVKRGSRVYEAGHVSGTSSNASSKNWCCVCVSCTCAAVADKVHHGLLTAGLPG
jgi:hypothetical protein